MRITIHRGTHEIGGSCVEIKSQNSRIIIDIGVPIVTPSGEKVDSRNLKKFFREELISTRVFPNVSGLYKQDRSSFIDGMLISHSHLDHYGLYNFVDKGIQYYLGEATNKLINLSNIFIEDRGAIENINLQVI